VWSFALLTYLYLQKPRGLHGAWDARDYLGEVLQLFFRPFAELAGAGAARLTSATGDVTGTRSFFNRRFGFFVAKEFLQCPIKICV